MKANNILIVAFIAFIALTSFTEPTERIAKKKYLIEVESFKNVDAKFDIIITMPEGQTTKLVDKRCRLN